MRSRAERAGFRFEDIDSFDDDALETFLDPSDGGVDAHALGLAAIGCAPAMVERLRRSLPASSAKEFLRSTRSRATPDAVAEARRRIIDQLLWPLVYWTRPDDYEQLIRGEEIAERVVDELGLDGKEVCDIGAGSGRFTLRAAPRARRVVAIDAVPVLLQRLMDSARRRGLHNIEPRRGAFRALPLADGSVDVAVACSSFTAHGPHGGVGALFEAERVVRAGGLVAIIWPQKPRWLRNHGYEHVVVRTRCSKTFEDQQTAERLCSLYYSRAAERWVRAHRTHEVPYSVLGGAPPADVCVKLIR